MALVSFEKKDFVLRVALNRVSALNAINSGLLKELETGLAAHAADTEIRVLMLFGRGDALPPEPTSRNLLALIKTESETSTTCANGRLRCWKCFRPRPWP